MSAMDAPDEERKRQKAVALHYAELDAAPRVVAAGAGEIAKRILELAAEHGIPVQKNDSLVDILAKLNVGYEIPPETYRAVAEILAFLYRTDAAWRKRFQQKGEKRAKALSSTPNPTPKIGKNTPRA